MQSNTYSMPLMHVPMMDHQGEKMHHQVEKMRHHLVMPGNQQQLPWLPLRKMNDEKEMLSDQMSRMGDKLFMPIIYQPMMSLKIEKRALHMSKTERQQQKMTPHKAVQARQRPKHSLCQKETAFSPANDPLSSLDSK